MIKEFFESIKTPAPLKSIAGEFLFKREPKELKPVSGNLVLPRPKLEQAPLQNIATFGRDMILPQPKWQEVLPQLVKEKFVPDTIKYKISQLALKTGRYIEKTHFPAIREVKEKKLTEGKSYWQAYKELFIESDQQAQAQEKAFQQEYKEAKARGAGLKELTLLQTKSPLFWRALDMAFFSAGIKNIPAGSKVMNPQTVSLIEDALPKMKTHLVASPDDKAVKAVFEVLESADKTGIINEGLEQAILQQAKTGTGREILALGEAINDIVASKAVSGLKGFSPELTKKLVTKQALLETASSKLKVPVESEIKKAPLIKGEIQVDIPKTVQLEIPGRLGSSVDLPYISASAKLPIDIGRQSFLDLSQKNDKTLSEVTSFLKILPSNLINDTSLIQSYSTKFIELSQIEKNTFDGLIKDTIKDLDDVKFESRIKSQKSLEGKVIRYLARDKDPANIADVVAGRLIVDDIDSVNNVLDVLQASGIEIIEVQDYFTSPTNYGYRGINLKVKLPSSIIAELQIHTPESIKILNKIHSTYEKWRDVSSPEYALDYQSDIDKAREISDKMWQKKKPKVEDEFMTYLEKEFGKVEKPEIQKEIERIESEAIIELQQAEAGERILIREGLEEPTGIIGKPSTFPKWIPEHLRNKKTLDAVAEHLLDGTSPPEKFKNQKELYDLVKSRVLEQAGVPQKDLELALKYLNKKPESINPRAIIPPADKYAFNFNLERLNLTKQGKEVLKETVEQIKPELEKIKGKPLTHKEVLEEASKTGIASSALTREQQKAQASALYNLRAKITELSDYLDQNKNAPEAVWKEYVEALKTYSARATEAGRMLESLKIKPEDKPLRQELIEQIVKKTDANVDKIVEASKDVDFNNLKEVQSFYRKLVKPSLKEFLDEYRYINMLSSPKTNIVNAISNLVQFPIESGVKLYSGIIDKVASSLTGRSRQHYIKETKPFVKGYLNAIPEAFEKARETFAGKTQVLAPRVKGVDVMKTPVVTEGIAWKLKALTRAMEAADMFFHTLFKAGQKEALAYKYARQGKEIIPEQLDKLADDMALYSIFRGYGGKLKPEQQGVFLDFIDNLTLALYDTGRRVPLIRWFVPFVQTPMEVLKQGIELSPLGIIDIAGSQDKITKLARTLLGLTVMGGAGYFALEDKITWSAPTGKKEREYFYASGRKPYSIKLGDKWVSYSRIGPIAYPIAWVSAVKHYSDEKGLNDSQLEVIGKATLSMAGFFSDQSYMQQIGDLLKVFTGSEWEQEYYLKRALTDIPRQLIPMSSFQGWISRILDDTYRDADTAWETIKTQIPFLSKSVKPYLTPTGEPSKRQLKTLNAISPVIVSPEDPFYEKLYQNYINSLKAKSQKEFVSSSPDDWIRQGNGSPDDWIK